MTRIHGRKMVWQDVVQGVHLGKCRKEGVVYQVECGKCKEKGERKVYIGETGRSVFERMVEQWRVWRDKKTGSSLWKHAKIEHEVRSQGKQHWNKIK